MIMRKFVFLKTKTQHKESNYDLMIYEIIIPNYHAKIHDNNLFGLYQRTLRRVNERKRKYFIIFLSTPLISCKYYLEDNKNVITKTH